MFTAVAFSGDVETTTEVDGESQAAEHCAPRMSAEHIFSAGMGPFNLQRTEKKLCAPLAQMARLGSFPGSLLLLWLAAGLTLGSGFQQRGHSGFATR